MNAEQRWWFFRTFTLPAIWSACMMLALGWVAIFSGWHWAVRLIAAVPFFFGVVHLVSYFGKRAAFKARGL